MASKMKSVHQGSVLKLTSADDSSMLSCYANCQHSTTVVYIGPPEEASYGRACTAQQGRQEIFPPLMPPAGDPYTCLPHASPTRVPGPARECAATSRCRGHGACQMQGAASGALALASPRRGRRERPGCARRLAWQHHRLHLSQSTGECMYRSFHPHHPFWSMQITPCDSCDGSVMMRPFPCFLSDCQIARPGGH